MHAPPPPPMSYNKIYAHAQSATHSQLSTFASWSTCTIIAERQRAKCRRLNTSICKYFSSSSSMSSSSTLSSATAEETEEEGDSTNDLTDDTLPTRSWNEAC